MGIDRARRPINIEVKRGKVSFTCVSGEPLAMIHKLSPFHPPSPLALESTLSLHTHSLEVRAPRRGFSVPRGVITVSRDSRCSNLPLGVSDVGVGSHGNKMGIGEHRLKSHV